MDQEPERMGLAEIAAALRRRREERGLSLADAQTATRIRTKYLQALEEGDVTALPEPVYVRGFLRAYGDYLGLDGHALVESFDNWRREACGVADAGEKRGERVAPPGSPPRMTAARRRGGAPRPRRRRRTAGRWLAAVGLILAVLYVVGVWPEGRPAPTGPAGRDTGAGSRAGGAAAPRGGETPVGELEGRGTQGPGPGAVGTASEGDSAPDAGSETGSAPPRGGTGPAVTAAAALDVRQAAYGRRWEVGLRAPVAALEVAVRASGRCWVRAVVDDRPVYEGVLQAGEERRFAGGGSVRLRLGNPSVAVVTVNGTPLPSLGAEPVDVVVSAPAGAVPAEGASAPGRP